MQKYACFSLTIPFAFVQVKILIKSAVMDSSTTSNAVALRPSNWQLSPRLEKNVKNRFSANPEAIFIQRTQLPSIQKALEYLEHVLHNSRCVRRLNLNVQVSSTGLVESLLEPLIGHGKTFSLIIFFLFSNYDTFRTSSP
ncbi:hypothetical protein Mgra_00009222 [Meloidogyne graminicola]|uniref:Uncharacterized protein n=1 Tax=Meloidogyne graminicola TaxID=189291 RepID=A0A8S9ZDK6_9BILA|nr:hypothetical protein Mgra_00009222 [Meloidogyne graminicola]